MKCKAILIFFAFLLLTCDLYAGRYNPGKHNSDKAAERTTLADPREGFYDIKYLKFNLHATDTNTFISGDVSTTAQVITASMSSYAFELDTTMIIDSAKINGVLLPVTSILDSVRSIALPTPLSSGAMFTAQIFYHGTPPPAIAGAFFNAVTHAVSSGGTNVVFTVSDPWVAKDWWPSKQSVDDKIDSVDMYVTVPRGVVDGSNGLLVNVDSTSVPGYWQYHWQTHYAITYYLISISVARFAQYTSYMHFTGSADSMLIQNFFMDTATFNPLYKANFDSIDQIINYYSSVYGRYPFWKEKYGVCYTTLPGGMEHQTMTTIGVPYTYIIAHELCHQWFGDHVSYADWGDVWLSEGFACFSEQLFLTHFWGAAAGLAHRQTLLSYALSESCGELYVTDTSTATTIFNYPTVYAKGQGVVTMLRYLAPTDSMFFQVLQNYQHDYGFGNANTADLQAEAEAVYGFSLDTFFNQWVYGSGYPKYTITWDQVGSAVFVKLVQTASCPTITPHFSTMLELQLHSATADTIIKVYNSLDTQIFSFNWTPVMSTVYLNPDVWTICEHLTTMKDPTLSVGSINVINNLKIYPNPTKNYWQVGQLPKNTILILTDVNGRTVWQGISGNGNALIPGANLPAGDYLLKVGNSDSVKLVHW